MQCLRKHSQTTLISQIFLLFKSLPHFQSEFCTQITLTCNHLPHFQWETQFASKKFFYRPIKCLPLFFPFILGRETFYQSVSKCCNQLQVLQQRTWETPPPKKIKPMGRMLKISGGSCSRGVYFGFLQKKIQGWKNLPAEDLKKKPFQFSKKQKKIQIFFTMNKNCFIPILTHENRVEKKV